MMFYPRSAMAARAPRYVMLVQVPPPVLESGELCVNASARRRRVYSGISVASCSRKLSAIKILWLPTVDVLWQHRHSCRILLDVGGTYVL